MNIKQTLKLNNITQAEFSKYLGVTRIGLNKTLNHGKQSKAIEHSLKLLLATKEGFVVELIDDKITVNFKQKVREKLRSI